MEYLWDILQACVMYVEEKFLSKMVSKLPKPFSLDKREIYYITYVTIKKFAIKITVPMQQNPPLISVSLHLC
jgi:hypothetical protein